MQRSNLRSLAKLGVPAEFSTSGTRESNAVCPGPKPGGLTVSLVPVRPAASSREGDVTLVLSCHPLWSSQYPVPPAVAGAYAGAAGFEPATSSFGGCCSAS